MKTLAMIVAVLTLSSACGAQVSWKDVAKKAKEKIEKPASSPANTAPTPAAAPSPAAQPAGGVAPGATTPGRSKLVECTAMAEGKPGEARSYYFYAAPFEGVSDGEILGRPNPYLQPTWQAMRAAWREHLISEHPDRFNCTGYIAYQCGTPKVMTYSAPADHPEWATLEDWRYTEASLSDSDKLTAASQNGAPNGVCAATYAAMEAKQPHLNPSPSASDPNRKMVKGFMSCSTLGDAGISPYFSDVFPVELGTHPGGRSFTLDTDDVAAIQTAFTDYLTKMHYQFHKYGPPTCDFSIDEAQARAAKHKRAYEGNLCSNCGKVVETGWKMR